MIKPINNHILIEIVDSEAKNESGIILPGSTKSEIIGKVIAVGSGITTTSGIKVPLEVQAGDRIMYSSFAGEKIKYDNQEYIILEEKDVLSIIE